MNAVLPIDWLDAAEPAGVASDNSWTALPPNEQLLLWSMRHMLVCWPSCGSVRSALHQAYGDAALGVEHLLRCLLTAVGSQAARRLRVGDPTCAILLPDEDRLLAVVRASRSDLAAAGAALAELCAEPRAARFVPIAASLADAASVSPRA